MKFSTESLEFLSKLGLEATEEFHAELAAQAWRRRWGRRAAERRAINSPWNEDGK